MGVASRQEFQSNIDVQGQHENQFQYRLKHVSLYSSTG